MRSELISSAVTFLKDPNVAEATLEKKIEFLESKQMTKDEIDEALRLAAASPPAAASHSPTPSEPNSFQGQFASAPYPYSYNPPPLPTRDWKDYFVMSTVSVGVAYGLYQVAKRYVLPMILPPTPASLEADKAALEAEFARTEALVEQLAEDTKVLKESEQLRAETFEQVIKDARDAVASVQAQADERKQDLRLLKTHVDTLQNILPKSLERHKESQDAALKSLQDELKSLKQLISNRTKVGGVPPASAVPTSVKLDFMPKIEPQASNQTPAAPAAAAPIQPVQPVQPAQPSAPSTAGSAAGSVAGSSANSSAGGASSAPSIPAWQRAAAK